MGVFDTKSGQALGLIETRGVTPLVTALDGAIKTAKVALVTRYQVGGGLVAAAVCGEVGAVQAALQAAEAIINSFGVRGMTHVIARPDPSVWEMLEKEGLMIDDPEPGPDNGSNNNGPDSQRDSTPKSNDHDPKTKALVIRPEAQVPTARLESNVPALRAEAAVPMVTVPLRDADQKTASKPKEMKKNKGNQAPKKATATKTRKKRKTSGEE